MLHLYLMTEKGLAALNALLEAGLAGQIAYVTGARDTAVGQDFFDEIRAAAVGAGLPYIERQAGAGSPVGPGGPYALAIGWRWLIPEHPGQRLIVLHDSLLPRYRGFAPLVNALIKGEERVGVTALYATREYDRGDILAQRSMTVQYPIRITEAIGQIGALYAELSVDLARALAKGEALTATPQDEAVATYSLWRDEEDYRLDWSQDAALLRRQVDATGPPYLGAQVLVNGSPARLLTCQELPDVTIENRKPGKVIWMDEGRPVVVCGRGLLRIDELVAEGEGGASLLPLKKFRTRFT